VDEHESFVVRYNDFVEKIETLKREVEMDEKLVSNAGSLKVRLCMGRVYSWSRRSIPIPIDLQLVFCLGTFKQTKHPTRQKIERVSTSIQVY
jgi:hypothetical protein